MIALACPFVKYPLQMVKQAVPPGAMHRAVCEVDPTVPSVRLTTVDAILAGTLANRRSMRWPSGRGAVGRASGAETPDRRPHKRRVNSPRA